MHLVCCAFKEAATAPDEQRVAREYCSRRLGGTPVYGVVTDRVLSVAWGR